MTGGGVATCIMQGWFSHSCDFLPNENLLAVFLGTHFKKETQNFIIDVINHFPNYFSGKEIGCRDKFTLNFCQKHDIKSYFSRCLTLTLPKRKILNTQKKIFAVNLNKKFETYLPKTIRSNIEHINQKVVFENAIFWHKHYASALSLLTRYQNEAKLIITTALHCAAPCVALGIPVILIKDDEEQEDRFSTLDGILKIYTLKELKQRQINFNPTPPNIEELKQAILNNLKLSILKAWGEEINEKELLNIREKIARFNVV